MPPGAASDRPSPGREVMIGRYSASDVDAVLRLLDRCSRETLFHRFHGHSDGRAYVRGLLHAPNGEETTVVARCGSECVGLATLATDETGLAHLGVLVEDAWQRRGLGRRFVTALAGHAIASGRAALHADVLADDLFIVRALRRLGPISVSFDMGSCSVDVDLGRGRRREEDHAV